ncbi:MAG: hypothetical protein UV41_C0042G0003 [Candidatus Daviesbacteria bacterium GW2011_GWA2_42_7]|uniref:Uncharacterized protein n=1 Tax=Candidatus Daviesbacteria bacterium GW2011_GWA2_42_7 TaxID=1618425 RepID=A0A0G1B9K8_9BACT|nr:MAG: hypothetical protein UV41_C0042G0003 [Candidatus Daviesbacteria bacterium GW2011_GWA2_42_7]
MINSYFKYIKTALEGAKYHEELAFLFAHPKRNEFNKIVFHLRAYFWELWSVWDYVLQYVNVKTLKLDPYDVRRDLLKKIKANMPYYQYLPLLEKIQNEDRLYRIMWLRDHAHKWQINPYLVDYNDEGVQVISLDNLNAKDKSLPRQINIDKNDFLYMKKVVKTLIKSGLFGLNN